MRLTKEEDLIPVGVLTGFLGSGKTSILRRILAAEEFGDSAVLINEFGEVGLDQILVSEIAPDVVLLNSGCLCCTLRGELRDALSSLLTKRTRGEIPPFKRVIVETTGLAQPSLILSTVLADPQIRHHYGIGDVVSTVDAMHALQQVQTETVWIEQVTAADDLLITKTDLVDQIQKNKVLRLLDDINPTARRLFPESLEIIGLFSNRPQSGGGEADKRRHMFDMPSIERAGPGDAGDMGGLTAPGDADSTGGPQTRPHASVATVRISADEPIDWEAFGVWLSMLLHAHGENIMRVKGLLYLEESEGPLVIQGVRHVIHPPEHLPSWGSLPKRTDLVFILRDIDPERVRRSFNAFILGRNSSLNEPLSGFIRHN